MNTQEPGSNTRVDFSKGQSVLESLDFESGDLGEVISVHRFSVTGILGLWGTLASLFGLVVLPLACYETVMAIRDDGIGAILKGLLLAAIGLPLFCAGVLTILNFVAGRKDVLRIYEKGFELRKGSKTEVWRWEDIEEVRHVARSVHSRGGTRYSFTSHTFFIRGSEQKPLEKTTIIDQQTRNVLAAGRRIQDAVVKTRLPETLERLERGEQLSFGSFEINDRELWYTENRLQWPEVGSIEEEYHQEGTLAKVETEMAMIVIRKRGESQNWAQVLVSEVPNDRLFLFLANHLIQSDV